MKKVYLLFVASIAMIASAFAADLQIDATKQYQLKFTMEAGAAGNIYAKVMAVGDDDNFIDIGGGTTAANPVPFTAGTQTYTSPLNNPIGSPTAFNTILFDFAWTQAGTFKIYDVEILDAEGNNLLAEATFSQGTCYYAPNWVTSEDYEWAITETGMDVTLGATTNERWQAQFNLGFSVPDPATAVDETAAPVISAVNGTVCCDGDFRIYDLAGVEVTGQNGSLNGNYIVVANGESIVVNVK